VFTLGQSCLIEGGWVYFKAVVFSLGWLGSG